MEWDNTLAEQIGNKLVDLLDLKVKGNGAIDTSRGEKLPIGLAKCVKELIKDTEGISADRHPFDVDAAKKFNSLVPKIPRNFPKT